MTIIAFYANEGSIYAVADSVGSGGNNKLMYLDNNIIIGFTGRSKIINDFYKNYKDKKYNSDIHGIKDEIYNHIHEGEYHNDMTVASIVCGFEDNVPVYYDILYSNGEIAVKFAKMENLILAGAFKLKQYQEPVEELRNKILAKEDILNSMIDYVKKCVILSDFVGGIFPNPQLWADYPVKGIMINSEQLLKKITVYGNHKPGTLGYFFKAIKDDELDKLNIPVNKRDICLIYAITHNKKTVVSKFLSDGFDINMKSRSGSTSLIHELVTLRKSFDQKFIMRLIKDMYKYGADINMKDKDGNTPLALSKDEEMSSFLIKLGATI